MYSETILLGVDHSGVKLVIQRVNICATNVMILKANPLRC